MTDGKGLAARVRSRRAYRGWTREVLADKAGLDEGTVGNIERGETTDPKNSTMTKLADALDVSLDWLAYGERRE